MRSETTAGRIASTEKPLENPLLTLLNLSEAEKETRGLRYTPREIFQQPGTWETTYQRCLSRQAEISLFLEQSGIGASHGLPPIVFLVGAGTSDYVGRALTHLLRRQWCCEVCAVPSTDLLADLDDYILPGREYLWISFSRSGESSEGVAVLERALRTFPNVRHLVITCNQAGAMAQLCSGRNGKAHALVLDDAVNDRGLAMTSSFSNLVIAGQCLAHFKDLQHYRKNLTSMVELGERFLSIAAEAASSIAQSDCSKTCFVGSGVLRAVADESALKLLELTAGKVHTMSESTLGLRHGPMSALDQSTLFVQFLSNDLGRRSYEMDLLEELRAKKLAGMRVVVTPREFERLDSAADHVIALDAPSDFDDAYRVPVDIMLGQLLGLFASLRAGLKPDCPSPSGAISRVISGVKIYS